MSLRNLKAVLLKGRKGTRKAVTGWAGGSRRKKFLEVFRDNRQAGKLNVSKAVLLSAVQKDA